MASQHLKVKATSNLLEIVDHLGNLVSSLKEGTIYIRKGDKAIALTPCEPFSLELEAEIKQDKNVLRNKLSIELKWKKSEIEIESDEKTFVISHEDLSQDKSVPDEDPLQNIVISHKDPSGEEEY
jgi:amphi-Trp domain-containing protein